MSYTGFHSYVPSSAQASRPVGYRFSDRASLQLKWLFQKHTLDETFMCRWREVYGLHCGSLFCGNNLTAHLRDAHDIHGADKKRVYCLWEGCNTEMNKESIARHVEEKHLMVVYPCGTCRSSFTRRDTLKKHKTTCSG